MEGLIQRAFGNGFGLEQDFSQRCLRVGLMLLGIQRIQHLVLRRQAFVHQDFAQCRQRAVRKEPEQVMARLYQLPTLVQCSALPGLPQLARPHWSCR